MNVGEKTIDILLILAKIGKLQMDEHNRLNDIMSQRGDDAINMLNKGASGIGIEDVMNAAEGAGEMRAVNNEMKYLAEESKLLRDLTVLLSGNQKEGA